MGILLNENERIDDLERNGYRIIQNKKRFCFGMDAVLLSGFIWEGQKQTAGKFLRIADLGTGTGIIPLLLHGRMAGTGKLISSESISDRHHIADIYGLEIQEEVADMARRSVQLNRVEHDIHIIIGDIKEASGLLGKDRFDIVTSNPPYMKQGTGLVNPNDSKAISRHEVLCTFDDVAREAGLLLKNSGSFYLVHRPARLTELIRTLEKYKLEPKRMRMVHSFADSEAAMVLIEARKGSGTFLKVEKPLIIYKNKGEYTDEILQIYYF